MAMFNSYVSLLEGYVCIYAYTYILNDYSYHFNDCWSYPGVNLYTIDVPMNSGNMNPLLSLLNHERSLQVLQ